MIYAVLFEDSEKVDPEVRQKYMSDHLTFLVNERHKIKAAGPLSDTDRSPAGGLWLVDADNPEAVQHLVKTDPFWPTGLRKSFRILAWTQVFADGKCQISV